MKRTCVGFNNDRHTINDILEVVEVSLDQALMNNSIRFRFPGTIIPDAKVLEFNFQDRPYCCIIAATASSVHRLLFPHPATLSSPNISVLSQVNDSVFSFPQHHILGAFRGTEAVSISAVHSTLVVVGCVNGAVYFERMRELDGK